METLQNLIDSSQWPILTAFLLGIMMALSPCPLATNITAIAYISKDIESRKKVFFNGLIYTAGRGLSYFILALILYFGASRLGVSRLFMGYGEKILGPLLVIIGILMLGIISWRGLSFASAGERITKKMKSGSYPGSLLLGIVFALAFCPYSGVLFFGLLVPLSVSSPQGLFLPLVFAVSTGIPVLIIAWLLAFSLNRIGVFYNSVNIFEKWFRRVVAIVFILAGIYFIAVYFFQIPL